MTTQIEALKIALENYMSAFGQALEAHDIAYSQQQSEADRQAREALAQLEQEPDVVEFGDDGYMKWQRVIPPIPWAVANCLVVADRHLPNGTRQHLVMGSVPLGLVVAHVSHLQESAHGIKETK